MLWLVTAAADRHDARLGGCLVVHGKSCAAIWVMIAAADAPCLDLPRLMLMMLLRAVSAVLLVLDVAPATANAHDASFAQHCRW